MYYIFKKQVNGHYNIKYNILYLSNYNPLNFVLKIK